MTRSAQDGIHLRKIGVDEWQVWRKLRLEALAEAPYAFSARLADWQGEGDNETRWRRRLSDVPLNVVAERRRIAIGMVSATAPDPAGSVELIGMWVAPSERGRGISDSLVNEVIEWARERQASRVTLGVAEANKRALALYLRCGFNDVGATIGTGTGIVAERRMVRGLLPDF